MQLSGHFSSRDFDCRCFFPECEDTLISTELVDALEVLAKQFGSIQINSGYRCKAHNKEVNGEPGSYHVQGMAADIVPMFAELDLVINFADKLEPFASGGIGIYNSFCHLDVREGKARWGDLSRLNNHG